MTEPASPSAPWECVVVGAGPAGLSAAVYMARFRRRTLVVDRADGRWAYGQRNENYLGFPRGVSARRLHALGRAQAEAFGAEFERADVTRVQRLAGGGYRLATTAGERAARTLIWAAGVLDRWPSFPGVRRLVGRHLFWCIVCDGWRTRGLPVLLIGNDDRAAGTTLQFLTYSRDLTLLVDPVEDRLSGRARAKLRADGVRVIRGSVSAVETAEGRLGQVVLRDGTSLRPALLFSLLGSEPNTGLLAGIGVVRARNGHVRIDDKNRTNLPDFFAAGDVSNKHAHQVVSAAHEGAQAAQAANHVLYGPDQVLEG